MARIALSDGFSVIPEGTYVFQITAVDYKEAFGKLQIHFRTQDGKKHSERFSLLGKDGTPNQGALGAFSYLAKTALNDFDLTDVDPEELVGHFIEAEITHDVQPSSKDPSKTVTFAHMGDKNPSDGWDDTTSAATASATAAKATTSASKVGYDLSALLGG